MIARLIHLSVQRSKENQDFLKIIEKIFTISLEISSREQVLKFLCEQSPRELVKSIFSQFTPRRSDLVGLQPELHAWLRIF